MTKGAVPSNEVHRVGRADERMWDRPHILTDKQKDAIYAAMHTDGTRYEYLARDVIGNEPDLTPELFAQYLSGTLPTPPQTARHIYDFLWGDANDSLHFLVVQPESTRVKSYPSSGEPAGQYPERSTHSSDIDQLFEKAKTVAYSLDGEAQTNYLTRVTRIVGSAEKAVGKKRRQRIRKK
ncbi:MAG: hypothetical protein HY832_02310 [Candidatus Aenigmarchaeota archaeon]|nr:hypothetical protein [Candidatus Aenigmarchaeota archaeon]